MDVDTYISAVVAGFEFLIALGSLIGLFGLVVGALLLFFGGRPFKRKGLKILKVKAKKKKKLKKRVGKQPLNNG